MNKNCTVQCDKLTVIEVDEVLVNEGRKGECYNSKQCYRCKHCSSCFLDVTLINQHLLDKHASRKCRVLCPRLVVVESSVKVDCYEEKNDTQQQARCFLCTLCGSCYFDSLLFNSHVESHTSDTSTDNGMVVHASTCSTEERMEADPVENRMPPESQQCSTSCHDSTAMVPAPMPEAAASSRMSDDTRSCLPNREKRSDMVVETRGTVPLMTQQCSTIFYNGRLHSATVVVHSGQSPLNQQVTGQSVKKKGRPIKRIAVKRFRCSLCVTQKVEDVEWFTDKFDLLKHMVDRHSAVRTPPPVVAPIPPLVLAPTPPPVFAPTPPVFALIQEPPAVIDKKGEFRRPIRAHPVSLDSLKSLISAKLGNRFTCAICNKEFCEQNHLRAHIDSVHEDKPFWCPVCNEKFTEQSLVQVHIVRGCQVNLNCHDCDRTFDTRYDYRVHIINVHQNKTFKCAVCNDAFFKRHDLKAHLTIHGREQSYCGVCNKEFCDTRQVAAHILFVHKRKHLCFQCNELFDTRRELENHSFSNHMSIPLVCHICEKTFLLQESLDAHILLYHHRKGYSCVLCGSKYFEKLCLVKHVITAHQNAKGYINMLCDPKKEEFSCTICGKTFSEHHLLVDHNCMEVCIEVFHENSPLNDSSYSGKKSWKCIDCCQMFSETSLKHICRPMQTQETQQFLCSICNETFPEHDLIHHVCMQDTKHFQCPTCCKLFSAASLLEHSCTHTQETQHFLCSTCCQLFANKSLLVSHTCIDRRGPNLHCPICFDTFVTHRDMQCHVSSVHDGINCPICKQTFGAKNMLKHIADDHRHAKFACPVCYLRFPIELGLRQHVLSVHSGKMFVCPICPTTVTGCDPIQHMLTHVSWL